MATFRYICYSALTSLKSVTATADVTITQVVYWSSIIANRLRHQQIKKRHTGAYLEIFNSVPVTVSSMGRKFIDLPKAIYDIEHEQGIDYINYQFEGNMGFKRVPFNEVTASEAYRLEFNPYEVPVPSNPYFYRVTNTVFFLGVDNVKMTEVEMGLYTAMETKANLIDLDSEMSLSDDQISALHYELLNMGRFVLSIPKDKVNDGTENIPPVSISKQGLRSPSQEVDVQQQQ